MRESSSSSERLVRDLTYKDLCDLLDMLERASKSSDENERKSFAKERLSFFFPDMDALQQMEMDYIADSRSEFAFDRFRNDYPDLRIDESGTSVPKKKNYAEIRAKALDEVYSEAYSNLRKANFHDSSKSDEDSQIYNAKSLSCLENAIPKLDPKDYAPARFMFLKKHPDDAISIGRIEEYIGKLGFDPKPISAAIVSYCSRKGKEESYRSFLFHLSNRLEVANKDANRDLPMTKDLIGRLKSLEELKK